MFAWAWRNPRDIGDSKVLIDSRLGRGRDGSVHFLGDWTGTLTTDGNSGYAQVVHRNRIVRAVCLAHARRNGREALEVGSKRAVELLRLLSRLFWLERAVARRAERLSLDYQGLLELRRRVRDRRSRVGWAQARRGGRGLAGGPGDASEEQAGRGGDYLVNQREAQSAFLSVRGCRSTTTTPSGT